MTSTSFGPKIRTLRRKRDLTQKQLAESLGISASYLNLIEHDKRPLSAPLLIKLAGLFGLDLQAFSVDDDARLLVEAMEVLGDPIFDDLELTQADVREFTRHNHGVAQALLTLYKRMLLLRESSEFLASRVQEVGGATLEQLQSPEEQVSDFIQRHRNYFPDLEARAERLCMDAGLETATRQPGMERYLSQEHGIRVRVSAVGTEGGLLRRYEPERRVLYLSELLPPRSLHFQLAVQIGLLDCADVFDRLITDDRLTTDESRTLARLALASYFAGAVLMPYEPFLQMARAHRYDVELIGHRFRTSYEQVCHRLTSLRRPGAEGVGFHLTRVDIAGNISKRFSGTGIRFARFNGACPKWNVHAAYLTPGVIRNQVSRFPDGSTFFCFARTVRKEVGGFHLAKHVHAIGLGCAVEFAGEIVYADGVDLENLEAAVPVGVTCRLCERTDCRQRAFPALNQPLHIDQNRRAINFYAKFSD